MIYNKSTNLYLFIFIRPSFLMISGLACSSWSGAKVPSNKCLSVVGPYTSLKLHFKAIFHSFSASSKSPELSVLFFYIRRILKHCHQVSNLPRVYNRIATIQLFLALTLQIVETPRSISQQIHSGTYCQNVNSAL
jgi:hypothetical protein